MQIPKKQSVLQNVSLAAVQSVYWIKGASGSFCTRNTILKFREAEFHAKQDDLKWMRLSADTVGATQFRTFKVLLAKKT